MVSKRQKEARKKFKEANPELFPKPDAKSKDPKTKKRNKHKLKKAFKGDKMKKTDRFRKHPLRVPGLKPGDSCFICKAQDHIAKLCPQKSQWEKNKICLLCRQRGHSLKSCPNKSDAFDKKFCYNCGEVGHSLSNCSQPLQDGGTKFAKCFICNESGHLSKNCSKNTHGIYPKGGSCKICSGLTHLAKDCPNKGNKYPVPANRQEISWTPSKERKPGHVIFGSGDDLDDDFVEDNAKNGKNHASSHLEADLVPLGLEVENDINVKPKKKQGPRVVNFMG